LFGLAICKTLAIAYGGALTVQSAAADAAVGVRHGSGLQLVS
jgi:signal transduction histidine kinase